MKNIKNLNILLLIVLLSNLFSCSNLQKIINYEMDYEYIEETYEVYYGHIINEATKEEQNRAFKAAGDNVIFYILSYAEDSITITINDKVYFSENLIVLSPTNSGYYAFSYPLTKKNRNPVVKFYSHKTKTKTEIVLDTRFPIIRCMYKDFYSNEKVHPYWGFSYRYWLNL